MEGRGKLENVPNTSQLRNNYKTDNYMHNWHRMLLNLAF